MNFPLFTAAAAVTKAAAQNPVADANADKWGLTINVLVTGVVVVFGMLLFLIGVIKLYSTIVYKAQNRKLKKKESVKDGSSQPVSLKAEVISETESASKTDNNDELIAVISAAAVAYMGADKPIKVTGIRRRSGRSEWSSAGISENVKAFRMGGLG